MATLPTLFIDATVLLGGAVVAAPLFKRIGLGTVLGYLALGVLLGPVINYVHDGEEVLHVAELGVVLLLFIVGLELKPAQLWAMRQEIFGLGLLQVLVCGLVIALLALLIAGTGLATSLVIGLGLALSSTAFALQLLDESGEKRMPHGKRAFSILLFQDIAIAPLLILVAVLAAGKMEVDEGSLSAVGIAIASVAALVLAGRYLLNPLFSIIAASGAREAMIAAALFIVMASAVLMGLAGLSMAMGAFIAGVMLAESNFRHELEANLEPFRGILLGLFFIAVGLSVDLGAVWQNLFAILALTPLLMAVKAVTIYGLCRLFGSPHNEAVRVAGLLPQHGEFGFVLFSAAAGAFLLNRDQASFLIALVTLSMALTPLSVWVSKRFLRETHEEEMEEDFAGADGSRILMIGFSRMAQVIAQALLAGSCQVTILDSSPQRIRTASRFGFRIYFGDGTRKEVLRAAGIENADIVAVCTNNHAVTDQIVELIQREFPGVQLYVRSYDRGHSIELRSRNVKYEIRETLGSALLMGKALLEGIGFSQEEADTIMDDVRRRDEERLALQVSEGNISAGQHHLLTQPTPEPLIRPTHEAKALDEKTKAALEEPEAGAKEKS